MTSPDPLLPPSVQYSHKVITGGVVEAALSHHQEAECSEEVDGDSTATTRTTATTHARLCAKVGPESGDGMGGIE